MRQVVGGRAVDAQAASASQMGRFETETLNSYIDSKGFPVEIKTIPRIMK